MPSSLLSRRGGTNAQASKARLTMSMTRSGDSAQAAAAPPGTARSGTRVGNMRSPITTPKASVWVRASSAMAWIPQRLLRCHWSQTITRPATRVSKVIRCQVKLLGWVLMKVNAVDNMVPHTGR